MNKVTTSNALVSTALMGGRGLSVSETRGVWGTQVTCTKVEVSEPVKQKMLMYMFFYRHICMGILVTHLLAESLPFM